MAKKEKPITSYSFSFFYFFILLYIFFFFFFLVKVEANYLMATYKCANGSKIYVIRGLNVIDHGKVPYRLITFLDQVRR